LSLASLQASGSPKEPLSKLSRYEQDEKLLAVARRIHKLIPANSLESQVRSHSTQSEFIQRIRQEINELLNRQKLRALHDSLLHQAAHPPAKGQSSSPVDRLIPAQEMFSKESPAGGERQLGRHTTVY
jgi:hypothetical protein